MIKRVLALVIVLAFSIESFAAVVGDNDGAAFITKAEFDSLKSSFQEQINRYNQSIDNKIDGAISAYLDGVKTKNKDTLMNASSVLSYPLNIYMSNKKVFDITKWNVAQTRDKIWSPGYYLDLWANRTTEHYIHTETIVGNYPANIFYVLEKINGKYKLSAAEKVTAVNIILGGPVNYTIRSSDWNIVMRLLVVMGASSWWAGETYQSDSYLTIPTDNNNALNWAVANGLNVCPFMLTSATCGVDFKTTNPTVAPYYPNSKFTRTSSAEVWAQAELSYNQTYADNVVKSASVVNNIYNLNNDISDDYLYTEPDGKIYLTNNLWWRNILRSTPLSFPCYSDANGIYHNECNKKFQMIVDGGFTLEPVGYGNATRDKEYKSLWKTNDIYYDVTCPVSKDVVECCLTKGILLTEFPNKEIEYAEIKFDVDLSNYDSTDVANLPKIVFSKGEIGYAEQESVQNNCITIFNDLNTATGEKVLTLTPGTNTIYIKEPAQLSKLYYKVFFANDYVGSVKITEPEVKILA